MAANGFEMTKGQPDWQEIYNNFVQALMGGELSPHLSDKSSVGLVALNGATIENRYTFYRYIDIGDLRLVSLQIGFDIPQSKQGSKDAFTCLQIPDNISPMSTGNITNATDDLGTNYQLKGDGTIVVDRSRTDGLHADWGYYTSFIYFAVKN